MEHWTIFYQSKSTVNERLSLSFRSISLNFVRIRSSSPSQKLSWMLFKVKYDVNHHLILTNDQKIHWTTRSKGFLNDNTKDITHTIFYASKKKELIIILKPLLKLTFDSLSNVISRMRYLYSSVYPFCVVIIHSNVFFLTQFISY